MTANNQFIADAVHCDAFKAIFILIFNFMLQSPDVWKSCSSNKQKLTERRIGHAGISSRLSIWLSQRLVDTTTDPLINKGITGQDI